MDSDSSIARDPNSNAILTIDKNKLQRYKKQQMVLEGKEQKINNLNDRILKLEELINTLINNNNAHS